MLIPLSEALDVTVSELLKGERIDNIDNNTEETVKTAISYRAYKDNDSSKTVFIMSVLFAVLFQLMLLYIFFKLNRISVFGIYFFTL
ncbi:MAG: hypothetical protein ACI4WM_00510 [Erysipelotrichaceae bacterium]